MGLAIGMGVLADLAQNDPEGLEAYQRQFDVVNRVLAANKLPKHVEPTTMPDLQSRAAIDGFPYSWIHYLRRALAYARQSPDDLTPVEEGDDPAQDPLIDEELSVYMDSHFICHSDCEGMYVPIDFDEVLYDDELHGAMMGSSLRVLDELRVVAPVIGITLEDGVLSDSAAARLAKEAESEGSHPYWKERQVWLTMFEAFRLSVQHRCAVVYR